MMRVFVAVLMMLGLAGSARAAELTLKRVMLSSGGVGYFESSAEATGNDVLGLDVPLEQVDDVLKSLVVFDQAGAVAGVELPGRDDGQAAFGDVPFGPEALQSPTDYLNALRGTEVTVQGVRPMVGRLLGAEALTETGDAGATRRTRVTLLSTEGLRQFVLEDVDSVQVADPALRARIERALDAMRRDAARATRHLTIRVKGEGKRTVSVGYVAGAPLWKATYRLVLPDASGTARLQGWATLENQSGTDWKGVALTLQYGNPVTFRQALYRAYFVQRPEVPVEILGRVLPDVDTRARVAEAAGGAALDRARAGFAAGGLAKSAPMLAAAPAPAPFPQMAQMAEPASAEETGEETIFTLSQPVDLAAGHSANLPIIDRTLPAERVGMVPFMQPHPLSAIRLRNDTAQSLPAGVLTLYDQHGMISFAGDARLGGLPAGETRLLSFARDLRTTVETRQSGQPDTLTTFSIADGVLTYVMRNRQVIRIAVTAPAQEARSLLLEIPKSGSEQTLTTEEPKPRSVEVTASSWRLGLLLKAGETQTVTAYLDQPLRRTMRLLDGDDATLNLLVSGGSLNAAGQAALRQVVDLRRDLARRQADVTQLERSLEEVQADEDRIRRNLAAVGTGDALRTRLMRTLDADETRIEQLRKALSDAGAEVEKARRVLADAIAGLRL